MMRNERLVPLIVAVALFVLLFVAVGVLLVADLIG